MVASRVLALNHLPLILTDGTIDWVNDATIKGLLFDDALTPAFTHKTLDELGANEITDPDYSRQLFSSKSLTQLGSGEFWTVLDADDINFGDAVTIAARYFYCVQDTGTPATSQLLFYVDLNDGGSGNVGSTASDFKVQWSADGIYRIDPDKDRT